MEEIKNYGNEYNDIKDDVVVVDTASNSVVDAKDLTPWQVIKMTAEKMGVSIKEPNTRNHCKHCHDRGYMGFNSKTKEPIPCSCIFTKEQKKDDVPIKMNREQRRRMYKVFQKNNRKKKITKEVIQKELVTENE